MSTFSLDQLLDATGISQLDGSQLNKMASANGPSDFSKLAERCRQAADATPEEVASSNHQDLVEKTATIAVIQKTLSEIQAFEEPSSVVKTAAAIRQSSDRAVFIKSALEAGHDPESIAKFLEKKKKSDREDKEEEEAKKKSSSSIIS